MIRMIDLTKLFGLIFIMTFGGPGGATETVAFNTYLVGFKDFRMSYASALSYVIIFGVLILTVIFLRVLARPRGTGGMSVVAVETAARSAAPGEAPPGAALGGEGVDLRAPWLSPSSFSSVRSSGSSPRPSRATTTSLPILPVWIPDQPSLAHYVAAVHQLQRACATSPTAWSSRRSA